jgi:hypothetical protein
MSKTEYERTSWRGIVVDHPSQWELSLACGLDEPAHIAFADRLFTRLDITWRPLTYVPNLDLLIEKYRQRKTTRKDEVAFKPLTNAGKEWRGVVRHADKGTFMHAARFFAPQRWLVEATIVWPKRRQEKVERDILDSIEAWPVDEPRRHWRALGMDVVIGREMELLTNDPKVGRVSWTFGARRKKGHPPQLLVERLAMVGHWMPAEGGLEDWLIKSLPEKSTVLEKNSITFNSHPAQRLLSDKKIGTLPSLRGLRQQRLDIAWICPVDGRLYHLAYTQDRRDRNVEMREGFAVDCCVPVPKLPDTEL